MYRPAVSPSAVDFSTLVVPVNAGFASGYVYVGSGCPTNEVNPSPWGSPFSCTSCDVADMDSFRDYAYSRADAFAWLSPLVGKILVCHCVSNKNNHTQILHQLITENFDVEPVPDYTIPPSCHANDTHFFSVVFSGTDMLDNHFSFEWENISNLCQRPLTVTWPLVWSNLVNSIRGAQHVLFLGAVCR